MVASRVSLRLADDLDSLVDFVAFNNPSSEHHIGYFGVTPPDIRSSIKSLDRPFNECFFLAFAGEKMVGTMGVEFDPAINRAWLYGPVVTMNSWDATADALYDSVKSLIPATITEHEMFVDAANTHCRKFADRHGFVQRGEWAIYYITAARIDALTSGLAEKAEAWNDTYKEQLEALHTRLFPNSNYTVEYIMGRRNDFNRLLITTEHDTLTGYLFMTFEPESGEGYIDLIGVHETYHRRGIGRRLMLAGLDQFRQYPTFIQANLTVDRHNFAALKLYDSLGFTHERDMVAYRRKLS